jgi:uncharacterized protein
MRLYELINYGLIYAGIGAFAGIMAGALGIGGGLIVVPGLLFIFQANQLIPDNASMQFAAGTSLAIMILTAQSALRAHLLFGDLWWSIFKKLWPGLLFGTALGALLAHWMPTDWLKILFALFLLATAFKMLADIHVTHPSQFPSKWLNLLVNGLIGLQSGLLGTGGGLLIVPYLTYCGLDVRKITSITNLCTLVVALVGTLSFMITGISFMENNPYSTGYVYWPAVLGIAIPSMLFAPLGVRLNYKLPLKQLRYCFIIILFITAISLLL